MRMVAVALVLLALLAAGTAQAAGGSAMARRTGPAALFGGNELDDMELQGFACLAVGGAVLGYLAVSGGSSQAILAFGGLAATPAATALAATGMVAASFCAVGAIAAPAVRRIWVESEALLESWWEPAAATP